MATKVFDDLMEDLGPDPRQATVPAFAAPIGSLWVGHGFVLAVITTTIRGDEGEISSWRAETTVRYKNEQQWIRHESMPNQAPIELLISRTESDL